MCFTNIILIVGAVGKNGSFAFAEGVAFVFWGKSKCAICADG